MKKLMCLIGLILLTAGCVEIGRGSATDTIHSYEYSGLLCKTWKVYLTHDQPFSGGSDGGGNDGTYSVHPTNEKVLDAIAEAKTKNKPLEFTYRTELMTWGCFDELHSGYAIIETAKVVE